MVHLVYCDNQGKKGLKEIDKIIDGSKKMIIRSAAGRKIPHSRVFKGEVLYFIEKGTKIINLKATVKEVQNFTKLSDTEITNIIDLNQNMLNLNDKKKDGIRNVYV